MNDAAATEHVCGLLLANGTRVALVGNGPLSEHDHAAIDAAPTVVRFNDLYHMRRGERITLWVLTTSQVQASTFRTANRLAKGAHAALLFTNRAIQPADEVTAAQKALGVGRRRVAEVRYSWHNPFARRVGELLNMSGTRVTTGFSTLNLVLHCLPPEGRVDLYGFSFMVRPGAIKRGIHSGDMEAALVRLAQHLLPDRLRIHETPEDLSRLEHRAAALDAAAPCARCARPLSAPAPASAGPSGGALPRLYLFPTGNAFHASCLCAEAAELAPAVQRRRVARLVERLAGLPEGAAAAPATPDSPAANVEALRQRLEEEVAVEDPYEGEVVARHLTRPFVAPEEAAADSWAL
ncbi:hypothetical protein CHLNCDRAFT_139162 [Chlorella variabilis]|uniref:Uncharacterized protein n=1 Tax=Chlorella variabilis TaxID=554065 RepID=E1ZPK8_CHLVA|nr:hypothetical protein CHLNCDRAFT_139162 [Chlorella variabilis]EFN52341.1 hypothetical protein CHLNCDRAFT_139162 [Chlorella variabilis]|eukprot:XP_005844443.1 hypothetical protein CHLNCDRAFT_139162 [Chlorella variabilis]